MGITLAMVMGVMTIQTLTRDYKYLDNEKLYVIKNVPYKFYNNDEEVPVYSAKVSLKVATLIDLMRSKLYLTIKNLQILIFLSNNNRRESSLEGSFIV